MAEKKTVTAKRPKAPELPPGAGKKPEPRQTEKTGKKAAEKTGPVKRRLLPSLRKQARPGSESARVPSGVPATPDMPVLNIVVFIIEWKAARYITEIFAENHVRFHFICKGRGTASSEVLDLLGIGASEKAVVFCLEQDVMVPILIREVSRGLGLYNPGSGIAFSVPLSGINKPILQVFKESIHKHISEKSEKKKVKITDEAEEKMSAEKKFDLIAIVVNQGFSDELMALARDAGATGGTIMNARGLVHKGPVKFLGISVQDEREIITILAGREKKVAIMQAVSRAFGINSKAKGIIFSLPAEHVTGLSQN